MKFGGKYGRRSVAVLCIAFFLCVAATTAPEADRAWQIVLELASGPGNHFASEEEAVKGIKAHLEKQEGTLRSFVTAFPNDPRRYSAKIRLSSVLAAKSRILKEPTLRAESRQIITDLANDPATPAPVKADAAFAQISQAMDDAAGVPNMDTRDGLLASIRAFDVAHPMDRRAAGLFTEIATLYDAQPDKKKELLDDAAARTTDESLRARINDDRKRLARLGNPLDLQLSPWRGGTAVRLSDRRGRVIVILFWASWSLPALQELARLEQTATHFSDQPVDFMTISLDTDRKALADTTQAANLHWLTQCDGHGWEGATVRELGINALPTVWILDRKGNLLSLNARGAETAELIQKALAQK